MKVLSLYLVDLPLSFYDHSPLSKAIHTYMHALSFIRDSVILRVVLSHNFNKFEYWLKIWILDFNQIFKLNIGIANSM